MDESVDDVRLCSNCHKLLDDREDKIVQDGSGACAHMYPHECIRYQRKQIEELNARTDEIERQYMVHVLPK